MESEYILICPHCESSDTDPFDIDSDTGAEHWECFSCGSVWVETLK